MAGGGMCANVLVASAIEWPPWLGLEPATGVGVFWWQARLLYHIRLVIDIPLCEMAIGYLLLACFASRNQ